jgi:hypothetical protein
MPAYIGKPGPADWPGAESSPYIHWWNEVERVSGQRDVEGLAFLTFRLDAAARSAPRFVPLARPAPSADAGPRRTLPIWQDAKGPAFDDPAVPDFGDPLGPIAAADEPRAVLVVIDTAINPLHERLRDGGGRPRLLAHWQMEAPFAAGETRVRYGRELRAAQIEAVRHGVSEDEALRRLGAQVLDRAFAPRGTALVSAHGTHVADLAGGTDPRDATAAAEALRGVPILAVSLPSNRVISPSGVFLEVFVDQALSWVEQRLAELFARHARPADWPPVAVNLSYGLAAGPKDGTGVLPERLAAFLAAHPTARLFLPAGNDGDVHGHARLTADGDGRAVHWLVMPSDPFSTFAELWFAPGTPAEHTGITLTPPHGEPIRFAPRRGERGAAAGDLGDGTAGGATVARAYRLARTARDRQGYVLCIAPTIGRRPGARVAPAGLWTVRLDAAVPGIRADLHLQSERPLVPGSRAGRPSRLLPCAPQPAPGPGDGSGEAGVVTRRGTLNAVAAATPATVIAGLRGAAVDRVPVVWGSWGDAGASPPFLPDAAFPAERSATRRDLRAAGYRSGSTAAVAGSSFACALAARRFLLQALGQPAAAGLPVDPEVRERLGAEVFDDPRRP